MFSVNKKFGSFVFGCIFAASYLWLVGLGSSASFLDMLATDTGHTLAHYSGFVTAGLAIILSSLLLILMKKGFNICTSDHPFWLALPSIYLLLLTTFSAFEMLNAMLYVAIPCLVILGGTAVIYRIDRQKLLLK